jgi:cytochrome c oxidase assembly protein subunit 15
MYRALKWLSVVSACGMFVVLVMGALVTNTGSAQGCGGSWPLCKGQFIPEMAFQTLVEFSHRAVTGAETVLVLALAAGTLLLYRQRREAQVLVPLMIVFLFLQALLGGLAVMFPESPEVLALHFGISLVSFASVVLTAAFIMGLRGGEAVRDRPVSRVYAGWSGRRWRTPTSWSTWAHTCGTLGPAWPAWTGRRATARSSPACREPSACKSSTVGRQACLCYCSLDCGC